LTGLRHKYPILRRNRFLAGEYNKDLDLKDVTWINANGTEMQEANWADTSMRCFGMVMDGRAQTTGIRQRGQDTTMLLVMNAHHDVVKFIFPEWSGGHEWSLLIDTNLPEKEGERFSTGETYEVTGRSLLLLQFEAKPA